MKKTVNIHLCEQVFTMDEDACALLEGYLKNTHSYFSRMDDGEEIANDIENHVAELLCEYRDNGSVCITLAQIEEIIAKQVRTTTTLTKEQQLIAGGFEANQGRLPWPIEKGYISGHFGKHQHPIHEHVTVNNKGIYLQTVSGAQARAIYEGEVTWCAQMNGSFAVIIQHGNYRSVYSQLKTIKVKQGDKVKAKQAIGEIMTNTAEDNKTELYFQIYKDRIILNPSLWLAQ